MKINKTRIITGSVLILTIMLLLVNSVIFKRQFLSSRLEVFQSPISDHCLVLYRYSSILPVSPGNSADAPGFIRLYNSRGTMIEQTDVEMVQLVSDVTWTEDRMIIKFVADWSLNEKSIKNSTQPT